MDTLENLSWVNVLFHNFDYFKLYWKKKYEHEEYYNEESLSDIFQFMRDYLSPEPLKHITFGYINNIEEDMNDMEITVDIDVNQNTFNLLFYFDIDVGSYTTELWLNDIDISDFYELISMIFIGGMKTHLEELSEIREILDYDKIKYINTILMKIRENFITKIIDKKTLNNLVMRKKITTNSISEHSVFEYTSS